jgi:hypothetical protein
MQDQLIPVTLHLTDHQAWALAQFLKRLGFDEWRKLAADEDEAYAMREVCELVRMQLAIVGYAPR